MATYFAYSFGTLFAGATFTEKIFGWHGMGECFVDSITRTTSTPSRRSTLFVAVLILISSAAADILYAALDPRVRI